MYRIFLTLNIYYAFSKIAFHRQACFLLANVAGLFTNTFFMLFRVAVFQAVYNNASIIAGYNVQQTLTYVVMVQSLIMVIPQWGGVGVAEDIRNGQIAIDLCRPINYYLMILSKRFGIAIFYLLARGIPALSIGIFFGFFQIIPSMYNIFLGSISMFLSVLLANSIHFFVELSGFWLESSQGPKRLVVAATYFLSGSILPVAFFPAWAKAINIWLPFQYTLNATIEIFLGTANSLYLLGMQIGWIIIISISCLFCLKCGECKITLHGG